VTSAPDRRDGQAAPTIFLASLNANLAATIGDQ
jgi:hypothetical protein